MSRGGAPLTWRPPLARFGTVSTEAREGSTIMKAVSLPGRGAFGVCLALWLALGPAAVGPSRAADGAGVVRGVLFREDETSRLPGAVVTAINVRTGRRYVSNHTGDNGAYEIAGLPAGTYDLAIEAADRLYVTDHLVELADAQRLYLSFAVQPGGGAAEGPPGGEARMTFTDPSAVSQPHRPSAAKKKGFWSSAGGITILSILVAGTVGAGVAAQRD